MHKRKLFDSFNYAIEGFMYVLKTQRNMRLHFLLAVVVVLLGIYFNFTRTELMMLFLTISLVFLAEMFNTGVELMIDLITDEFHPLARIIKDISAGAVLVASINAFLVGYILFSALLPVKTVQTSIDYIRKNPLHIAFICLLIVLTLVIFTKVKFGRGKPLRGGMPSGHAAIAFSMLTLTIFFTDNKLITLFMSILALWVSQGRIRPGYHTFKEVLVGALLGIGLTALIIFMLRI